MESTHDLDLAFWLLEPAKPVRVYSQGAYGYMQPVNGSYDIMWSTVTMDNGVLVAIGGGWNLPPSYPNYCATWIEITGTEGSLFLDDTQRDNWLNTVSDGTQFPMSTMPGEQVDHVFAGQMGPETIHFLEFVHPRPAGDGDAGERAHGDGGVHGRRPLGRAQRADRPAAVERDAGCRFQDDAGAAVGTTSVPPEAHRSPTLAPARQQERHPARRRDRPARREFPDQAEDHRRKRKTALGDANDQRHHALHLLLDELDLSDEWRQGRRVPEAHAEQHDAEQEQCNVLPRSQHEHEGPGELHGVAAQATRRRSARNGSIQPRTVRPAIATAVTRAIAKPACWAPNAGTSSEKRCATNPI